jgi:hypothetical protein
MPTSAALAVGTVGAAISRIDAIIRTITTALASFGLSIEILGVEISIFFSPLS